MSLSKKEKDAVVSEVAAQAAKAQTLALAEYRGLTVEHLDALRKLAHEKGVYLHVLRSTLARRAVAGTPFEVASESMVGPLIYGFSEDAVAAAKVLSDFAKTNDKLVIRAGGYGGKILDPAGVEALARLPTREILLVQLAGTLQIPIQRFAAAIAAVAIERTRARKLYGDDTQNISDPVEIARIKGLDAQRQIIESNEMLKLTDVASGLGVTVDTAESMLAEGLFFAVRLRGSKSCGSFPRWQFDPRLFPWMQEFIKRFSDHDGWAIRYFFHQPSLFLGEMSPLDFLGVISENSDTKLQFGASGSPTVDSAEKISLVLRSADFMIRGQE